MSLLDMFYVHVYTLVHNFHQQYISTEYTNEHKLENMNMDFNIYTLSPGKFTHDIYVYTFHLYLHI